MLMYGSLNYYHRAVEGMYLVLDRGYFTVRSFKRLHRRFLYITQYSIVVTRCIAIEHGVLYI